MLVDSTPHSGNPGIDTRHNSIAFHALSNGFIPAIVILILHGFPQVARAQFDDYSAPPIKYNKTEVNDPVAILARRVESGEAKLQYDKTQGFLPAVLKALDVSVSSQTLVFSKTSMQRSRISPERPRAIYFNDEVYIGFVQNGGVIEFAATDARQGATFYTLEQSATLHPQFIRDQGQCLTCHSSNRTQNVPGYLIRSVFAKPDGMPEFGKGTFTTGHNSPFKDRWGGWYVTGTHGDMRHMGNTTIKNGEEQIDRNSLANLKTLNKLVSTVPYPSPHSDIVALMVMEHQTQMHNAIAWANYETRRAIHQSKSMNRLLERSQTLLSESSERRIDSAADRVLKYLLMCDEFVLTSPVKGTSAFASDFESRGVRDLQNRSLRDFDLNSRMFRYPCSYMIYSKAFDGLPDEVRNRVLKKLNQILEGNEAGEDTRKFAHLSVKDRRNISQILKATKPEFAAVCQGEANTHDDVSGK
ncbi:MAG: hypothetical protein ACIAZJ_11875 [Gimesia chilikensis]|uniref:hypothetical protein n=1 Tax=Gimesia chilikensis TaxID=2605989 RepID=UPI0037BB64A7